MRRFITLALAASLCTLATASEAVIKPSNFTAPGAFPTSAFKKYYNNPTATASQVQPIVTDPITHETYPFSLTNPNALPQVDKADPHPLPPTASSARILQEALRQMDSITANPIFGNNTCAQCQALLEVAKFVALATPKNGPEFVVKICEKFQLSTTCEATFGANALGGTITQVLANADVGGYDGQSYCQQFMGGACELPPTAPLNTTGWFAKPKPNPLPKPKKPSGKRLKVLHLSDFHIDPRFMTGAEANCTSGTCCRNDAFNNQSPHKILQPAPRYGAYVCDTPMSLAMSTFEAIPALAGTEKTGFAYTIFTGDLVAHSPEFELSRSYVEYTESLMYDLFKRMLGSGPVYAALGNHDTYNQAQDAPHSLGDALADQFSWNYDHVASLWQHEGWLPQSSVDQARAHYASYSVRRQDGLRIIALNTDMWYRTNYFNFINMTDADVSGMLRFMTDELQDAEDKGDRVWIIGHVLTGWDGTNPLRNPTNLFYQIVDRFSPHVIANIFWGHTHEDHFTVFYANNGTVMNADTAGTVAWIGPSLTPITNFNAGFRVYEVDSATFDIMDAHTWFSDVNSFPNLDHQLEFGPTFAYEYNTRETYGKNVSGWTDNDPLNATWWHRVTESMEANPDLVTAFNKFQGKSTIHSKPCTGECIPAKICYMRSGSSSIAVQNCPPGFGGAT